MALVINDRVKETSTTTGTGTCTSFFYQIDRDWETE